MKNALRTFDHTLFGTLRIITLPGKENDPLFVAKDVAVALGFENAPWAVRTHCKRRKSLNELKVRDSRTLDLHPQTQLIPESDLYRLVMRSNLPEAERFQDWVVENVLPSIRKNGGYIQGQEKVATGEMSDVELLARAQLVSHRVIEDLRDENRHLRDVNAEQQELIEEEINRVTVDEWRSSNHLYLSHSEKVRLGQGASKMLRDLGEAIERQARTIKVRGGEMRETSVNVYPRHVLDSVAAQIGLNAH
jgi:prophage antirepressor-like protein